eukprot:1143389-Pelagomonas_calceolata.AAC.3
MAWASTAVKGGQGTQQQEEHVGESVQRVERVAEECKASGQPLPLTNSHTNLHFLDCLRPRAFREGSLIGGIPNPNATTCPYVILLKLVDIRSPLYPEHNRLPPPPPPVQIENSQPATRRLR